MTNLVVVVLIGRIGRDAKMTNKEAINTIKHGCIYRDKRGGKALEVALSALEKQIPKKPKIKYFLNIHGLAPYVKIKRCPSCGGCVSRYKETWVYPKIENKYCSHCGQALDWGDGE